MISPRFSLLLCLLASLPLRAALPADLVAPEYRLAPGENDAPWQPLLAALKAKPPLSATFEEHRFYPFRKGFARLTGEIRLDPARGLSLYYTSPEKHLLVVDARGGFMDDGKGRRRELPDDPRAQAATTALLNVMRFDLVELVKNFDVYAARDGADWRFTFVPRPGPLAGVLQPITVTGRDEIVALIEMRYSESRRIEILIADTHTGVTFTADELARFFR